MEISLYNILVILHVIGTAIGAGGATFSDYIFFKSASDGYIDKSELKLLEAASRLVSVGLLLLVVTGLGMLAHFIFIPGFGEVASKAIVKLGITAIVGMNGLFLHWYVLPLLRVHTHSGRHIADSAIVKKKNVILTSGAISIVSWYTALVLGAWRGVEASVETIALSYIVLLILGILGAQCLGWLHTYISKK